MQLGVIKKCITHRCTKSEKLKNIEKNLTPIMKEKIASSVLQEKSKHNINSEDIKLKTYGPPLHISNIIPKAEHPQ